MRSPELYPTLTTMTYDAEADRAAAAAIDAMRLSASRIWREERAAKERALRADLIGVVADAIKAESERIGGEVGWTGNLDEALATVAVDAVADYYRRAATGAPHGTPKG